MAKAVDIFGNIVDAGPPTQGFDPTAQRNTQSAPPPAQAPAPQPRQDYNPGNPRMPDLVAQVVEEKLPIPSFPMIVTVIDRAARKIPWFVWLVIGLGMSKIIIPKILSKWWAPS